MKDEVDEMIAHGLQAVEKVVESEGKDTKWSVGFVTLFLE